MYRENDSQATVSLTLRHIRKGKEHSHGTAQ